MTALAQFYALYSHRARSFNQWQHALYPNFIIISNNIIFCVLHNFHFLFTRLYITFDNCWFIFLDENVELYVYMHIRKLADNPRWSTYVIKKEIVLMLAFVLWNKSTERAMILIPEKAEKHIIQKF